MVTPTTKSAWRQLARTWRAVAAPPPPEADWLSGVLQFPQFHEAHTVALFLHAPEEPNTNSLFSYCHAHHQHTCVPTWNPQTQSYRLSAILPDTPLQQGPYGIWEPASHTPIPTSQVDCFIVPGLLFDSFGHRLGHGKGYYDRILADRAPTSFIMALAFDWQLLPAPQSLPSDPHDVTMHAIVTPNQNPPKPHLPFAP